MTTTADILKEIHQLRKFIRDLESKLADLPRQVKRRKDDVIYHEGKQKEAREQLQQLKMKAHEDDVSMKTIDGQIERYEKQLNEIMSKKEYDALKTEISHAKEKMSVLEDLVLEELTEIDERTEQLPIFEKTVQDAKKEAETYEKEATERTESLTQELEKSRTKLAETEDQLPSGEFRTQYELLVKRYGEEAFSPVVKGTCQFCFTTTTTQQKNELIQGRIVMCKSCGRIIYLGD